MPTMEQGIRELPFQHPVLRLMVPLPEGHLSTTDSLSESFSGRRDVALIGEASQDPQTTPLQAARQRLYAVAGGSMEFYRPNLSRLNATELTSVIRSQEFHQWVASEKSQGKHVFWLTDMDKTMAAGDIFTFFFAWRAEHGKFTREQNMALRSFLEGTKLLTRKELQQVRRNNGSRNAARVIELWHRTEEGRKDGISLLDFWTGAYWPSQVGMTKEEKKAQLQAFAPEYASKVFPGVREENLALKEAGVEVVLVSNGDQELAQAVAPLLGIEPRNVVGATLQYDENGQATGKMHTYEMYDSVWSRKPQPGKPLNFLYWLQMNRRRWPDLNRDKITVAAMVGDSASADGGAMIYLNPALAFFMVDTPGEPDRLKKFFQFANKYGGALGRGSFVTLEYPAPLSGPLPEIPRFKTSRHVVKAHRDLSS